MLAPKVEETPRVVLKPTQSTLVLIGALVCFGPILFVITIYLKAAVGYGLILFLMCSHAWLKVATIRVELYEDRLERKEFWRTSWQANLTDISLRDGLGGDIPFIPAIIVSDRQSGMKIGEILKSQFKPQDPLALKEALASSGVEIDSTPRGRK